MTRIAIFTTHDYTWGFPTWQATIPLLKQQHEVVGVYLFPEKLGKKQGSAITRWYFETFGIMNAARLGAFAARRTLQRLSGSVRTWEQLAHAQGFDLQHGRSPNQKEAVDWVRRREIDVLFIMVPNILKGDILSAPRIGIINKHAALLPSCRGVFPYIWGIIHDLPTGITFHQVDAGIDTGRILVQQQHPAPDSPPTRSLSLLRFYADVYAMYPQMAVQAVENLLDDVAYKVALDLPESYYSFPTATDMKAFLQKAPIARLSDIAYNPKFG